MLLRHNACILAVKREYNHADMANLNLVDAPDILVQSDRQVLIATIKGQKN